METIKNTTWAVVHITRQNARPRHVARLFITDVPDYVSAHDLTRALTRAGRQFGAGSVPWANHYVAPRAAWRDEVEGAWNRGDVACIAYAELAADAARIAVTLRLPRDLRARLQRVAQQRGVPVHTVIIEAVGGYVAIQEHMLGWREEENNDDE